MHTTHTNPRGPGRADVATFEDVTAWLDAATHRGSYNDGSRRNGNGEWYGHASFAQAQELGRYGWPDGRARMLAGLETITAAATTTSTTTTFDVAGAFPDCARAAAGEPLNMHAPGAEIGRARRVLTIRVWLGILADVTAAHVTAWGAALASHIDALESAGWSVDLHGVACAHGQRDATIFHAIRVGIKAPDQPLDIDRLAFIVAHAAAHRRINFAIREHVPMGKDAYGITVQPQACPAWLKTALDVDGPAIDIPSAGAHPTTDPIAAAAKIGEIIAAGFTPDE